MVINVPNLKDVNILGFIFWISEKKILQFFSLMQYYYISSNFDNIYLNNIYLSQKIDETKK